MKIFKDKKIFSSNIGRTIISLLMGFFIGALILAVAGYNPLEAYKVMFLGVFNKPKYIVQTIINSTPIIFTGISIAFAYKTGLFNIGAEGQFIIGSITAAILGYLLHLPHLIHVFLIIVVAGLAAGIWGGIAGFLKAKFDINEVITTIMLNWVAFYSLNYIVQLDSLKKPNAEATYDIQQSASIIILEVWKKSKEGINWLNEHLFFKDIFKTRMNWGILIAILIAVLASYIIRKTVLGYELRSVGHNRQAAEYGGINVSKSLVSSMMIAGGIAGIAGAIQVMGISHRISTLSVMEGYGFNGIAVGLIAGGSPIGCIFAGLLFSALNYGGGKVQYILGAPTEIIDIMVGVILLFVAVPKLIALFPRLASIFSFTKGKMGGEDNVD
ncbi:MAG: ABC transporter permease [Firmicutes bacterium]|nr:ABC transporter permease [Bacillota bacterium]